MKKKLISALLSTAMILTVTGCQAKAPSTLTTDAPKNTETTSASKQTEPAANGDEKQIILRFSWWGGDERLEATLAVINQFEALYPNIKIEPEYGGSDGYTDKLATQLAAGTEPDIMQIDPSYMATFVTDNTNYFVDLLADGFDFSQFEENYISTRGNGRYDGRQLGIPSGISGPALLINQELADAIGLDFSRPYTWNDLIEMGKKAHEYDESIYLIEANKEMLEQWVAIIYASQLTGKGLIEDTTGAMNLNEEQWTKVYELIWQLYENNVVPPASYMAAYSGDQLQTDPNWINGKYVGAFCANSLIANMTAANPNVTYSAGNLPVPENAVIGSWKANCPQLLCVSANSAHIVEAELFLDYFFNDPKAQETLGVVRSTPPTSGGRKICSEMDVLDPVVAQSADILELYTSIDSGKYSSSAEVKQILWDQIEAIGFGVTTPEKAAQETISLLKKYVESLNIQ